MAMIPLFKPFMPTELPELEGILHSGLLAYGKWGRLFESKLAEYLGESKILTVNSFNSAMLVVLAIIGLQPGDEIIASPMSCLASNQPFATQGLKVIWADIDPKTGTLDPANVRSKISPLTKAIFHNHYCGYPGYIDEINAIGKENNILIIDDAIEAFGSEYKGRKIGNTGADITVFSFQTVRLPNTVDGGAIAFKDKKNYEKALLVRDYGIDRTNFRTSNAEINPNCDISLPGFGATLSEAYSYIGCLQMDKIVELIENQRNNALVWESKVQDMFSGGISLIDRPKEALPNYWVFGILSSDKQNLLQKFRDKGYYSSGVHLPNNFYSVFGEQVNLPGISEFYSKFLALPCGWWVNINKFNHV